MMNNTHSFIKTCAILHAGTGYKINMFNMIVICSFYLNYTHFSTSGVPYTLRYKALFVFSVPRNYDPTLHPFEVCREYTRAMNATKLDRVFAKPFLASLDGHRDGVNCMAKHATSLSTLLSGSCDGEVTTTWPLDLNVTKLVGLSHCKHDVTTRLFIWSVGKSLESD